MLVPDFRFSRYRIPIFAFCRRADRSPRIDRVAWHTKRRTHVKAIVCPCMRNGACLAIEVGGRAVPSRLSVCSSSSSFLYLSPFYTCPHLTSVARRVARRTKHGPECKIRKTAAANKRTLLKQKRRQLTDVFITAKSERHREFLAYNDTQSALPSVQRQIWGILTNRESCFGS